MKQTKVLYIYHCYLVANYRNGIILPVRKGNKDEEIKVTKDDLKFHIDNTKSEKNLIN